MPPGTAGRLGILAGGGTLPVEAAEAAQGNGLLVHIVALKGVADPEITRFSHDWVGIGEVGAMLDGLHRAGCDRLLIIGRLERPQLWRLRLDRGFWRHAVTLLPLLRGGDDKVLRGVVDFFEQQGFEVVGIGDVAPELIARSSSPLATGGTIDRAAVETGFAAIAALGPFDIGQGAIVSATAVLAVEGGDGTDAMLDRLAAERASGEEAASGPAILVKGPKPGQELRVDLPALGPDTIRGAHRAGLAGIAVLDGGAVIAHRARVGQLARELGVGVAVVARGSAEEETELPTGRAELQPAQLVKLGRYALSSARMSDAALGLALLEVAVRRLGWDAPVAVIEDGRVLVLEREARVAAAVERVAKLGRGGRGPWSRRRRMLLITGAALQRPGGGGGLARTIATAAAAGIRALVLDGAHPGALAEELIEEADRRGLAVMVRRPP